MIICSKFSDLLQIFLHLPIDKLNIVQYNVSIDFFRQNQHFLCKKEKNKESFQKE